MRKSRGWVYINHSLKNRYFIKFCKIPKNLGPFKCCFFYFVKARNFEVFETMILNVTFLLLTSTPLFRKGLYNINNLAPDSKMHAFYSPDSRDLIG